MPRGLLKQAQTNQDPIKMIQAQISDEETTEEESKQIISFHPARYFQGRPYLIVTISVCSVTSFCFCSQVLLRYSKISNLSLNRYYSRKRFDKQKMMTNIILQSKQMR